MKTVNFEVDELECTSCANTIQNELSKKGLNDTSIDVVNKILVVNYDENKFSVSEIQKIIKKVGFNAELVD